MADYLTALPRVLANEGGYSNDPSDHGGETYRGISRKNFPSWDGWSDIDIKKTSMSGKTLDNALLIDRKTQENVAKFYLEHFWEPLRLSEIDSQEVANCVFDWAVNAGHSKAISHLQIACNKLNRGLPDMPVDGRIGPVTIKAANGLHNSGDDKYIVKIINILRGAFYILLMDKSPNQERFARGWMNRVTI